jgi:excisionase family DNA binding protein
MVLPTLDQRPIAADERTVCAAQELQQALATAGTQSVRLALPSGEVLPVPDAVDHALREVIAALAAGDAVTVLPLHQQLTTNQAARLLEISRPTLIALLERGEIPYRRTGTHRRVQLADVLAYKARQERAASAHLDAILAQAQESGGYF